MDDLTQETPKKNLPFNNLYLNSGVVHGYNSSWMYFLTLTFLITGYFFFQALIMFPLMNILKENGFSSEEILNKPTLLFNSEALQMDRNIVLMLELGMFVAGFIGFFIGLRYIHKKTLTSILTGYERFRFRRFWYAFAVWGVLLVVVTVGAYLIDPEGVKVSFNAEGLIVSVIIMALFMPIQTGLEEMVFRGYLVQGLSQIFRNGWIPLLLASLLFGAAHMTNPEVEEYGWPIMLSYYCLFALFMGAIVLIDEGLELAFGIHLSNNLISSIMVSSDHSVIKTYSIFETKSQDPYIEIVMWAVLATITFFLFKKKYGWHNFQLILK